MTAPHQQSDRTIRKTLIGTDRRTRLLALVVVNGPMIVILSLLYVVLLHVLPQTGLTPTQAHLLATVAVAIMLLPMRWRLVNFSHELLHREWQDGQSLIREISDTLSRTIEPAAIDALLAHDLPDRLRLSRATLWMLQPPDDRVFLPLGELKSTDDELLALGASAQYVGDAEDYVLVSAHAGEPWAAPFEAHQIALVLALRIGNRLIGMYGFGPPLRQRDYPPQVIGMLLTLAPAIASALENARAYTKIARLNAQLYSLDRRKDEFIESVGHELRTPLTSLSLATQLIAVRPEVAAELASVMYDNVGRLQALIDRILSMAAPESVTYVPAGPIDIRTLVAEVVSVFVPIAQRRGIDIASEIEPELIGIGEAARLRRALHELLDNAVRYSTPGRLVVRAVSRDGLAIVSVSDQGPGIPADERGELFSRFFRGRQTRALASTPGAGIGLSIAQREIELLGGRLWLEQTSPAGTTMCLAVPTPELPMPADTSLQQENIVGASVSARTIVGGTRTNTS